MADAEKVPFDLEDLRSHIQSQIERISSESLRRSDVLSSTVDERAGRFADQVAAVDARLTSLRKDIEERLNRSDPTALTTQAVHEATARSHDELSTTRAMFEMRIVNIESELEHRRREFSNDLIAATDLINQRLHDLDRATELAAANIEKIPAADHEARCRLGKDFSRQLGSEREFIVSQIDILSTRSSEKFFAVDKEFAAAAEAVKAALTAAKEAVSEQNKSNSAAIKVSEQNTKEQLSSLRTETGTSLKALGDKVDDTKEQLGGLVSTGVLKAVEDKVDEARDRITNMESLTRGIKEATGDQHSQQGRQQVQWQLVLFAVSIIVSTAAIAISLVH